MTDRPDPLVALLKEAFEAERATREGNPWSDVHGRNFVLMRFRAALDSIEGVSRDPLDIAEHDDRRAEVLEMIEEADANADGGLAGSDSLADALVTLAEGWARASVKARLAAASPSPEGAGLDAKEHKFSLVFEDEVGDLARCSCGWQDFDFAQGKVAFAGHLARLASEEQRETATACGECYWHPGTCAEHDAPQSKTADLQSAELTTCSTYPRGAMSGRSCGPVVGPTP